MTSSEATNRADVVAERSVRALHGLLDAPGAPPKQGDLVPPLWHWLAFLPEASQRELGPDGHPRPDSALAPPDLPRRMFAAGEVRMIRGPLVGAPLTSRTAVAAVQEKEGRTGRLRFATLERGIRASGELVVHETQHIVYRPASDGQMVSRPCPRPELEPDAEDWHLRWDLATDQVQLFRFSALTYNAHRIHYDRPYATEVEGYPDLVVQGPLQAVALAELLRRASDVAPLSAFSFRSVAPAFAPGLLRLRGRRGVNGGFDLACFDHNGAITMSASASTESSGNSLRGRPKNVRRKVV